MTLFLEFSCLWTKCPLNIHNIVFLNCLSSIVSSSFFGVWVFLIRHEPESIIHYPFFCWTLRLCGALVFLIWKHCIISLLNVITDYVWRWSNLLSPPHSLDMCVSAFFWRNLQSKYYIVILLTNIFLCIFSLFTIT